MAENFIDADDAPEWIDADFERAEIRAGGQVVRPMTERTIYEAVVDVIADNINGQYQTQDDITAHTLAALVIQTIINRTPSPATVVELTHILREGGVEVPEVTFD